AGYGTTGNANIGQYKYGSAINGVASGLGEAFLFGNLNNNPLTWETALQKNLGIDFGFLNDRITGSVELYKKNIEEFLIPKAPARVPRRWRSGIFHQRRSPVALAQCRSDREHRRRVQYQ